MGQFNFGIITIRELKRAGFRYEETESGMH